MPAPVLSAIYRHPVKSMRGEALAESPVAPVGLPFDRSWMLADRYGRFATGREYPDLVRIGATPVPDGLRLDIPGREPLFVPYAVFRDETPATVWGSVFPALAGADEADDALSAFLGAPLRLMWTGLETRRRARADPSVPLTFADGYPLLLIGEASLAELNRRVGRELSMARFRPNLVVSGCEPFAEDGWRRIRINGVEMRVEKPCERCVFTTVDPETGAKALDQEPLRTLARFRRTPDGVLFGQNLIAEGEGLLRCGMEIEVLA